MIILEYCVLLLICVVITMACFGVFHLVGYLAEVGVRGLCHAFRSDKPARIYHTIRRVCYAPLIFMYCFLPLAVFDTVVRAAGITVGHSRACYQADLAETCDGLDLDGVRWAKVQVV